VNGTLSAYNSCGFWLTTSDLLTHTHTHTHTHKQPFNLRSAYAPCSTHTHMHTHSPLTWGVRLKPTAHTQGIHTASPTLLVCMVMPLGSTRASPASPASTRTSYWKWQLGRQTEWQLEWQTGWLLAWTKWCFFFSHVAWGHFCNNRWMTCWHWLAKNETRCILFYLAWGHFCNNCWMTCWQWLLKEL